MIEMQIEHIKINALTSERIVVLKEKAGKRALLIWIGPAEAEAIFIGLQNLATPRPLTHDLLLRILTSLGATVKRVCVNDLADSTFFANIDLQLKSKKTVQIDARPSDAIALAVRTKTPIFVEENVLEKAGIILEEEKKDKEKLGPYNNILEAISSNPQEEEE